LRLWVSVGRSSAIVRAAGYFDPRLRECPVKPFEKRTFLPPIEIMIVVAINLVVVIFGYYLIMIWGNLGG
jgi:hypothetical protein